jgi:hypothetical protein
MAISQTAFLSANIPGSYSAYQNDSMEMADSSSGMTSSSTTSSNPHQQNLIHQLLSMTEDDLNKLPAEGRQRMLLLREQILQQGLS